MSGEDVGLSWFGKIVGRRLDRRRNFLMSVVGETGSGKSWFALKLAQKYDWNNDFDENHIIFSADEFLNAVSSLYMNCFIVIDEAGLMYSHREYQSMVNKMLSFVMQSFRYKYINCIFTVPNLGFMDYVGRSLMHYVARMLDHGYAVIYRTQKDQLGRKIYHKKIGTLRIEPPTKDIIQQYEDKKAKIMDARFEQYKTELATEITSFKHVSPVDILRHIREYKIENRLLDEEGKFDAVSIVAEFDISLTKAYVIRKMLNRGLMKEV